MNLNCVICAELFMPADDVHVTTCGHLFHYNCLLQWLQRSKTCPQCRNKCSDRTIHKIYFNLANLDTSRVDIGSLQEQLENANLQIKIGEQNLKKAGVEIENLKNIKRRTLKTISGLEKELEQNKFLTLSYSERIKILQVDAKVCEDLRAEVKQLKQQAALMENLSSMLSASQSEADKLLNGQNDPKTLSIWVANLKRELRSCESKKSNLRNLVTVVQHDLRKEQDLKKLYEERISLLESENYRLQEMIKTQQQSNASTSKASPINLLSSPSTRLKPKLSAQDFPNTPSPGLSEKVKRIEESQSPYFNIKSSSVGLAPLLKLNDNLTRKPNEQDGIGSLRQINSDLSQYSIFKKRPRLCVPEANRNFSSNMVSNGMGGSEKRQFESPQDMLIDQNVNDKVKSIISLNSRLKSGKLRKYPSVGSERIDNFLKKS